MRRSALLTVGLVGVLLGGCGQSTLELASDRNFTPRDKLLLAHAPYASARIPESYRRHIVDYHRPEPPGTILVDTDARYLYYVLPQGKAIRYGVTVGEKALAWSGVARVGRKTEWPDWIPTSEIQARLGPYPPRVVGGPANPLGARGIYLYQGNKDTLYRIHGTNQPEYIGQAISSGCIRMTNEDVIDLYDRVKMGAMVVVLAPGQGLAYLAGFSLAEGALMATATGPGGRKKIKADNEPASVSRLPTSVGARTIKPAVQRIASRARTRRARLRCATGARLHEFQRAPALRLTSVGAF